MRNKTLLYFSCHKTCAVSNTMGSAWHGRCFSIYILYTHTFFYCSSKSSKNDMACVADKPTITGLQVSAAPWGSVWLMHLQYILCILPKLPSSAQRTINYSSSSMELMDAIEVKHTVILVSSLIWNTGVFHWCRSLPFVFRDKPLNS